METIYFILYYIYIRVRGEAYRQKCADIKNTFSKTCHRELARRRFIQRINVAPFRTLRCFIRILEESFHSIKENGDNFASILIRLGAMLSRNWINILSTIIEDVRSSIFIKDSKVKWMEIKSKKYLTAICGSP